MLWRVFPRPLLVVALCLLAFGCASAPKLTPKARVEVPVATGESRTRIVAKPLDELVVALPPLENAEHHWTIGLNDERILRILQPIRTNAAGHTSVSFFAVKPGRRLIRFFALPPATRESSPSQIYEVAVEIQ